MSNEYLNNKVFESIIERFQRSQREKAKYTMILEDISVSRSKKGLRKNSKQMKNLNERFAKATEGYELADTDFEESKTELASAFQTLSEHIVRYAKFSLIEAEDAVQEGVMICYEKVGRFDPTYVGKNGKKAKAFNYLTTCILNHFRQLYRSARNYNELKKRYHEFLSSQFEEAVLRSIRDRPRNSKGVKIY